MKNIVFKRISTLCLSMIMTAGLVTPVMADDLISEDVLLSDNNLITEDTTDTLDNVTNTLLVDESSVDTAADTIAAVDDKDMDEQDNKFSDRMQYILENDPGIIWMPVEEDDIYIEDTVPSYTNTDENAPIGDSAGPVISNDRVSQIIGYSYTWPETQLTTEERAWVINRVKEIVAENITDDMSDIEKYWTLEYWVVCNIKYKNDSSRTYAHDTPHGSYGALKYGSCVCQGYSLLYSHLCHAAGLPCDEIVTKKEYNHMINYIPNINGNSYYVDVTGDMFLLSDETSSGAGMNIMMKDYIENPNNKIHCTDNSFVLKDKAPYRYFWGVATYDEFYHIFIARDNTSELGKYCIASPYSEKGSGIHGQHYAHYADYALQDDRNTGNWELDDFFDYPKTQLSKKSITDTRVDFAKNTFNCNSEDEYLDALENNLILIYTQEQGGKRLKLNTDYYLALEWTDETEGCVRAVGINDYTDSILIRFNIGNGNVKPDPEPVPEEKKEVSLSREVYEGKEISLLNNITNDAVLSIDDTDIVSVSVNKGHIDIKGLKPGDTKVTVETEDTIYLINITVNETEKIEKTEKTVNVTVDKNSSVKRYDIIDTFDDVKYTVENNNIAKIFTFKDDRGFGIGINGKDAGSTKASVETKDTLWTINITVKAEDKEERSVMVVQGGKVTDISIAKKPSDGRNYRVTYSAKGIASVSDKGIIQGCKPGTTVATITTPNKITTLDITVINPVFSAKNYVKNTGDSFTTGFDAQGLDVTYTSNKPSIATVDETGTITAVSKGSATITAIVQGKKYNVGVKVYDPMIFAKNTVLLTNNKTESLSIKNGNGKTQWSSSDPAVVIVDGKGKIKGISKGSATITAVNNGREMGIDITVYNVPKFEQKVYTTNTDEPITVALTKDEDMDGVIYTVNNTKIATIDENGLVTPVKKGNVTVSAKVAGKTYKTKVKIQ